MMRLVRGCLIQLFEEFRHRVLRSLRDEKPVHLAASFEMFCENPKLHEPHSNCSPTHGRLSIYRRLRSENDTLEH